MHQPPRSHKVRMITFGVTHHRVKGRIEILYPHIFAAGTTRSQLMNDMKERVCRIAKELNALLVEARTAEKTGNRETVEDLLTTEVISEFKSSLNAMRHLLWMYIETASHLDSQDADYAARCERLAQAAEMLRVLRDGTVPAMFSNAGF